jgi:hypothetical protein
MMRGFEAVELVIFCRLIRLSQVNAIPKRHRTFAYESLVHRLLPHWLLGQAFTEPRLICSPHTTCVISIPTSEPSARAFEVCPSAD